jgi:hypothetical protein
MEPLKQLVKGRFHLFGKHLKAAIWCHNCISLPPGNLFKQQKIKKGMKSYEK